MSTIRTDKPKWKTGRLPKPLWHGRTGLFKVVIAGQPPEEARVTAEKSGLKITFDKTPQNTRPGRAVELIREGEFIGRATTR